MMDFGFILFLLGALGYVSGLLQKPWPRKTLVILFAIYLAGSCLKCKNDSQTKNDLSGNDSAPSEQPNVSAPLTIANPVSYTDAINQAKDDIQKGNFQKALDDLSEAATLDTENKNAGFIRLFRIQVLIDMKDFNKALGELLQINPADLESNETAWYFRYFRTCYVSLGDVKKANEYSEKLVEFQYPVPAIGPRTRNHDCALQGQLQDKACTPGAVVTDAADQVCSKDYSKTNLRISRKDKSEVLQEYGMKHYNPGDYNIDYLVPVELGGANTIANLWPEAVEGYNKKKKLEKYLHDEVCAGRMSLSMAQKMIVNDWASVYRNEVGKETVK